MKARVREVGEAFVGVWKSELAALAEDLGRSGRALVRALALLGVAAGVGFWTLGLMLYFAIELLALVLPRWGAVGVVLGALVLTLLVLALLVRGRLRAVESPAETVRRRVDDHRRWWRDRVAGGDPEETSPDGPEVKP